jgi:L-aminopeptidase/D-esterase-like protein
VAVLNANGSPVDPSSGLPWQPAGLGLQRPLARERRALVAALTAGAPSLNTTIGAVVTSADLSKAEVSRMASVAHDGLARAVRPAHSVVDGDTIFGLATGAQPLAEPAPAFGDIAVAGASRVAALNLVLQAAADTFAAACTHALLAATKVGDLPTFFDLCPSVRR